MTFIKAHISLHVLFIQGSLSQTSAADCARPSPSAQNPCHRLQIKLLRAGATTSTVEGFLAKCLDSPSPEAISAALRALKSIGAMDAAGRELTPLGVHLAGLPVDVRVGKMLIYAAMLGCLQPVATIAAAMTSRSPFVSPLDKRDEADAAKVGGWCGGWCVRACVCIRSVEEPSGGKGGRGSFDGNGESSSGMGSFVRLSGDEQRASRLSEVSCTNSEGFCWKSQAPST